MHFLEVFIPNHQLLVGHHGIAGMQNNEFEGLVTFHTTIFGLTTNTLQPRSVMNLRTFTFRSNIFGSTTQMLQPCSRMHFLEDFIPHHQLLVGLTSIAAMQYNEFEGRFSSHTHICGLTTKTFQPCSRMHFLEVFIPHNQLKVGHKHIAAVQYH